MLLRKVKTRCREEGEKVGALKGIRGVLPYDCTQVLISCSKPLPKGEGGIILSMPSRPEASTRPLAERAKLSLKMALPATIGKMALD